MTSPRAGSLRKAKAGGEAFAETLVQDVRHALRMLRQLITESLVLAMLGGGAGALLGTWGARALAAMRLPGDLPVRFDIGLDRRVLA